MSSPAAPPKRKKTPLLLGACLVLLGGGGVVGWKSMRPAAPEHAAPRRPVAKPGVVELEPFVLNLSDPAGDRFLRLNVRLVLDRREVAVRASDGLCQAKLRDRVLSVLAKKRASELTTVEGKEALRSELVVAVEPLLGAAPCFVQEADGEPAHVNEVYFTEFLVQ